MKATKYLMNELQSNLWQFGLNPSEWRVHLAKANLKKQNPHLLYNIKVINNDDHDFYFDAKAVIKNKDRAIHAKWESLQVASV